MPWYQHAVFYELYLRAFCDSDSDGHGDFTGLRQKLDYLEWLGVDCIWILPTYPSPLKDDGYDIASFFGIHSDFGLIEDFRMTVDEIHRRGMRIITDLVMNHTSDQHPWFKESRRAKDSPRRNWYVWSETDERYQDARIIFLDTETSNWAYDEVTGEYYWHRFYSSQPDLNYDNPAVVQAMMDVVRFWLDMGIDGFRVDAVPYLVERQGTNCENLPETHDVLKRMRAMIDAHYGEKLLLGEANQWPEDVIPYFGDEVGPEFHMNFHFPLMPRLYMAMAKQDNSSILDILARTPEIMPGAQWATFLRNHDELTLEMVTDEERQFMWETYSPELNQRMNLGIRRRLASLMDNNRDKILLMYSMLFTLPGTPVMYYGDEIGMGDNVELFDRNGVRTPMQWDDSLNGGFSTAPLETLYAPPITGPEFGYSTINVQNQREDKASLLHHVRRMIQTYKSYDTLAMGELAWLEGMPQQTLCFTVSDNKRSFLILHNLSAEPVEVQLPAGQRYEDMLYGTGGMQTEKITLKPYAHHWLIHMKA